MGILGIQDSPEIHCGIPENAKFLYAIRELTATVVKESGNTGSGPPTTSRLLVYSNPGSLLNILITNQTTYTYNPAQLSLIFYSTSR